MGEFSSSLHLISDNPDAGSELLVLSRKTGWVFPPTLGWVTVVLDTRMPEPAAAAIVGANRGLMLDYLNIEEYGWSFRLFDRREQIQAYSCTWTHDLDVDDAALDIATLFETLTQATGTDLDLGELHTILEPGSMHDLIDPTGRNPGHRFAAAIGLHHAEHLSGYHLRQPHGPGIPAGVVYIDA